MKPTSLKQTQEGKREDILFCIAAGSQPGQYFFGSSDFGVHQLDISNEMAQPIRFEDGHQSYVTGLAVVGGNLISGSYDRQLIWWDIESRKPARTIPAHNRWIRRVLATPEGSRVVTVADDMLCKVWNVETAEFVAAFTDHRPLTPHDYPSMLYAVAISDDGSLLATGDKVGHVSIWDMESFAKVGELEAPTMYTWDPVQRRHSIGGIRSLAFSPDGEKLAVGGIGAIGNIDHLGGPARLEVFQWRLGKQLFVAEDNDHKGLIEQIAWASDERWIVTAGGDHKGFVTFHDAETGERLHQEGTSSHIHGFVFDRDAGTLAACGHQHWAQWNLQSEAEVG